MDNFDSSSVVEGDLDTGQLEVAGWGMMPAGSGAADAPMEEAGISDAAVERCRFVVAVAAARAEAGVLGMETVQMKRVERN